VNDPAIVIINADGGSRGNPGPAGYGAVVYDGEGNVLAQRAKHIGNATNNVAEYRGLLAGLEVVAERFPKSRVHVRLDSKLIVEQMTGRWKIKHPAMRELALQARDLLSERDVEFEWVPREENEAADALANAAMDGAPDEEIIVDNPRDSKSNPRVQAEVNIKAQPEVEPVTVVLIRHGHSLRDQQKVDGEDLYDEATLTPEGTKQVRQSGQILQLIGTQEWSDLPRPSWVVSSPRQRTRETAREVVKSLNIPEQNRALWEAFRDAQGAELPEIGKRVKAGLDKLASDHPGECVVVASHGKAIKAAVGVSLGLPETVWSQLRTPLASVTILKYRVQAPSELVALSVISS